MYASTRNLEKILKKDLNHPLSKDDRIIVDKCLMLKILRTSPLKPEIDRSLFMPPVESASVPITFLSATCRTTDVT